MVKGNFHLIFLKRQVEVVRNLLFQDSSIHYCRDGSRFVHIQCFSFFRFICIVALDYKVQTGKTN